jgi:hypothetical protein
MAATITQAIIAGAVVTASAGFAEFGKDLRRDIDLNAQRIGDAPMAGLGDYTPELGCSDGTCQCFVAGTLVATEAGDRPIESLRVGDAVWAFDVETGELALKPVLRLFVTPDRPVMHVEMFSDVTGNEQLTVTAGHPFWVEDEGWVGAVDLNDDALRGKEAPVYGWAGGEAGRSTVYNVEVADFHSYFVGQSRALVHNANGSRSGSQQSGGSNRGNGPDDDVDMADGDDSAASDIDDCIEHMLGTHEDDLDLRNGAATPSFLDRAKGGTKAHKDRPKPTDCSQPSGEGVARDVCQNLVKDCRAKADNDDADKECLRQGACVYDYLAQHPTSSYFAAATRRESLNNQCSRRGVDVHSCYGTGSVPGKDPKGDSEFDKACEARKDPDHRSSTTDLETEIADLKSRLRNEQDVEKRTHLGRLIQATEGRKNKLEELAELDAKATLDDDEQKRKKKLEQGELVNLSQDLGETAAMVKMEKDGYECVKGVGGRDEFDVICAKEGPSKEIDVVIVEAKGGSSQLAPRWGFDNYGDKRVQQGTPAYLDTIIAAMEKRGTPGRYYEGRGGAVMSDAELLDIVKSSNGVTYMHVSASADCTVKASVFELNLARRAQRCQAKNECCGDLAASASSQASN